MKTFAIVENGVVVNRVLGDEALPGWIESEAAQIGWVQTGGGFEPPSPPLDSLKAAELVKIDRDTDAIYSAAIGSRGPEYEAAEREAQAYADADYTGTPGMMVSAWAQAKGWTAEQAADDILEQAGQWRAAMAAIRAGRLSAKESVRNAAGLADFQAASAQWTVFVGQARAGLGL